MAKKKHRLALRTIERRVVQVISLVGLHLSWGPEFKWFCMPVLTCHSCALAWFACPIGVFVHYSGYQVFPFLALGTVLLLGAFIGRLLCGWVCPFGFLQDMLHKIPSRKVELPGWTANVKYGVLIVTVFLLPFMLGEQTMLSFCRVCPASALEVTIPNIMIAGVSTVSTATIVKLSILILVLGFVVVSSRGFCKVFCPIGALLAPLNFVSLWKIRVPTQNCAGCRKCAEVCPQGGDPGGRVETGVSANRSLDCIVCYECQTICPRPKKKARNKKNTAGITSVRSVDEISLDESSPLG